MKHLAVDIPDEMGVEIQAYVKAGYFRTEQDLLSAALQEFFRRHRIDLEERYQLDDIRWAAGVAEKPADYKP